jgi:hypothetical protein
MVVKIATRKGSASGTRRPRKNARPAQPSRISPVSIVMEEARRAGLLDGDKTEHLSFRAPKALIEAAKRESGATKPTELGLLALAMVAQPDPTAKFMKETRGALGPDHQLEY